MESIVDRARGVGLNVIADSVQARFIADDVFPLVLAALILAHLIHEKRKT
jgi:hypothetical protein